ncbi:LAFE_0E13080g1_1 [Lachancea fermentati]|uniref:LAFE_0E13080g1_1 n=1 Tax=Lachancea fermentati TaxID=4955 RepID=A0A1G4ME58_LACFM|nr:LAFE_0E13080g1_1 [Lachancea fermentati]
MSTSILRNYSAKLFSKYCLRTTRNALLVVGSATLLSYPLWGNHHVSSETVTGIKQYTTESSDSENVSTISLLSDKEVTQRLRQQEQSYYVQRGRRVIRYDVAQLPSNAPIEDNHVEQVITVPGPDGQDDDLYFFGVFDGHGGPYTSSKLAKSLVPYVAHQLSQVYTETNETLTSDAVDSAFKNAFKNLDRDITEVSLGNLFSSPSKENLAQALPAISGACALLTMYDSMNSTLKCAVTGDSRALLASVDENGQWTVQSLSIDQTGDNPEEVDRIRSEHPGEPNVIRNGRILGSLQPSRAFGDYRYKIKEIGGKTVADLPGHMKVYFRREPRDFLTPPYVTAEPVVTSAKVGQNSKFMVLASDGLFELLSNEDVAALVIKWMEKNKVTPFAKTLAASGPQAKLPSVTDISEYKEAQRPAFRYRSKQKNAAEYLMEDSNVSTHLIRNALSARGNKEYVSTLVSIPSPMSRKYRDDLTVTVVFFGGEEDLSHVDGQLLLNHDATAGLEPKL